MYINENCTDINVNMVINKWENDMNSILHWKNGRVIFH